jgi:hypothetical protein
MGQIVRIGNGDATMPSREVRRLVGAVALAQLCNRTTEAIRKWDRPKSKGGTGGLIPAEFQARILDYATEKGLPLKAEDLIAEPVQ